MQLKCCFRKKNNAQTQLHHEIHYACRVQPPHSLAQVGFTNKVLYTCCVKLLHHWKCRTSLIDLNEIHWELCSWTVHEELRLHTQTKLLCKRFHIYHNSHNVKNAVLIQTVCSAAAQRFTQCLREKSSSYLSSPATKFQCKHFSAEPPRPQKPPSASPHLTPPHAGCLFLQLPSWGDRLLNGFIGTVQCLSSVKWGSQWDELGLKEFTQQDCGVGRGGGGSGGVLLPLPLLRVTQTSPSPPALLSVAVR